MDIIMFIILYLVSIIPSIILYIWLKRKNKKENNIISKSAFVYGLLSIFPIVLLSGFLAIMGNVFKLKELSPILYQVYYNFIVLAFAEEFVKIFLLRKLLKRNNNNYSWFNIIIFMTIIGIGFGISENFVVAIGSNFIIMIIRAISIGHAGYGFIMGYFYGKMLKTNKKIYGVLSFIIPWFLHSLYDFGLSDELLNISDNYAFISVLLEFMSIVLVFIIIRFVIKKSKCLEYITPLKKMEDSKNE